MKINLNRAYIPQAGDVLSWVSGEEKILFVVVQNSASEKMIGIALYDNRRINNDCHIITITNEKFNYRLQLVCKANKVKYAFDQILDEWREENE